MRSGPRNATTRITRPRPVEIPCGYYPIAQTLGITRCDSPYLQGVSAGGTESCVNFIWHGPSAAPSCRTIRYAEADLRTLPCVGLMLSQLQAAIPSA